MEVRKDGYASRKEYRCHVAVNLLLGLIEKNTTSHKNITRWLVQQ